MPNDILRGLVADLEWDDGGGGERLGEQSCCVDEILCESNLVGAGESFGRGESRDTLGQSKNLPNFAVSIGQDQGLRAALSSSAVPPVAISRLLSGWDRSNGLAGVKLHHAGGAVRPSCCFIADCSSALRPILRIFSLSDIHTAPSTTTKKRVLHVYTEQCCSGGAGSTRD